MADKSGYGGRVLVAGATGRTGSRVVRRLLHYGVLVRVFVRSAEKALEMFGGAVEMSVGKSRIVMPSEGRSKGVRRLFQRSDRIH